MIFSAKTIPHSEQRYPTVGDWSLTTNGIEVNISSMSKSDYEFLVALHEVIEAYLCQKRGISEQTVTDFDVAFEKKRKEYDFREPGNTRKAPYKKEHRFASRIERLVGKELGVDWNDYSKEVNSLD